LKQEDFNKIVKPFLLNDDQKKDANNLVQALFKILIEKYASLIEINPLIITKDKK
jgi:succinyl-CoA synthetase beta subunit